MIIRTTCTPTHPLSSSNTQLIVDINGAPCGGSPFPLYFSPYDENAEPDIDFVTGKPQAQEDAETAASKEPALVVPSAVCNMGVVEVFLLPGVGGTLVYVYRMFASEGLYECVRKVDICFKDDAFDTLCL